MLSETRKKKGNKEMVGGKSNGVKGRTFYSLKLLAMCKKTAKRNGEQLGGKGGEEEGEREGEKERFMEK